MPAHTKRRKNRVSAALLLFFAVFSILGCSTIVQHKGTATGKNSTGIYRGTRDDAGGIYLTLANVDEVVMGDVGFGQWSFYFLYGLVDLPFSFVADTVCLPYDLATLGGTNSNQELEPTRTTPID